MYMNLRFEYDLENIDWNRVVEILKEANMAHYEASIHKKAFENSYSVVFVFDQDILIGFGRAISDGAYQGAIYDVAVLDAYQGRGVGRKIVEKLIENMSNCNIILYSAVGKEIFYERMNFRKMKTGMAIFSNSKAMKEKGFTE